MKKITFALLIYFSGTIVSCCSSEGTTTYHTIESARGLLFSFDENGIFPYLDEFNPSELGISVSADSLTTRVEVASSFSTMDKAYACDDPNEVYYTNTIDSINIYTVYDYDQNHPAGSNINDILLYLDGMGETSAIDVNQVSSISNYFKFSAAPQYDSLQFKITGRITEKENFTTTTALIVLP